MEWGAPYSPKSQPYKGTKYTSEDFDDPEDEAQQTGGAKRMKQEEQVCLRFVFWFLLYSVDATVGNQVFGTSFVFSCFGPDVSRVGSGPHQRPQQ